MKKFVLGAAVDAGRKAEFEAVAQAKSVTASRLLGELIDDFLHREPRPAQVLPPLGGPKSKEVAVRLTPFHYAELQRRADLQQWSRSTYLANLFYIHLDAKPRFRVDEVGALRQIARELANIGRNVNQIAKSLHCTLDSAHLAMALDFEMLHHTLDVEAKMVKELVRGNLDGWGVSREI
jgi:hypothetical protein